MTTHFAIVALYAENAVDTIPIQCIDIEPILAIYRLSKRR